MRAVFNVLAGAAITLVTSFAQPAEPKRLIAQTFNSGFDLAHDTYNAISTGSDGRIYYVLSSESIDVGAKMFVFDPATKTIELLGDITEASGEKGKKAIAQGKSHVNFVESEGKLYFATHIGYYSIVDGMEKMGIPPSGYKSYPGGHLLAYDMKTRKFEDIYSEVEQSFDIHRAMKGTLGGVHVVEATKALYAPVKTAPAQAATSALPALTSDY